MRAVSPCFSRVLDVTSAQGACMRMQLGLTVAYYAIFRVYLVYCTAFYSAGSRAAACLMAIVKSYQISDPQGSGTMQDYYWQHGRFIPRYRRSDSMMVFLI